MATYALPNQARTVQTVALVSYLEDKCYLMISQGNSYGAGITIPTDLAVTESATISDINNPLFFKKINKAGADSKMLFVKPDPTGTISIYSQRYTEVLEANVFTENVRHIYIEVLIPANNVAISGIVRGAAIVSSLREDDGTVDGIAITDDVVFAANVNFTSTTGNHLVYLENIEEYNRSATAGGELFRIILAI